MERTDSPWLRWSVAFVWLWTGLAVLHPYYRQVGHEHLAPLGLPDWVMVATCVGEVLLAGWVASGAALTAATVLQAVLIAGFTTILLWTKPLLLFDPFGMLVKNVPLLAVVGTAWLLEREGWSPRAHWLLRGGVASIWIIEGWLPKLVSPQPAQTDLLMRSGLVPFDPLLFVRGLGAAEVALGILLLLARGRLFRVLLAVALVALVVFPVLVGWLEPLLWVHPFGPLTKNVPIIAGTLVLLRQSWASEKRTPEHVTSTAPDQ